jgi:hypothetical protein
MAGRAETAVMPVRAIAVLACLLALAVAASAASQTPQPEVPPAGATPEQTPPAPQPADPEAGLRAGERIARRYGRIRNSVRFHVSLDGIPDEVNTERFVALAESQGRRWGHRPAGVTYDAVSLHNHRTEVGFSGRVPSYALGLTRIYYRIHYRRLMRCRVSPTGVRSGCITLRVERVGIEITDRDILLRRDVPWALGPVWPTPAQFDLQTTLLHEFGHLAGNMGHAANCSVAPMTPSLAPGDWWRSTLDHRVVCRPGARSASLGPRRLRFAERRVYAREYEDVLVGRR